jgi:hypothetical protein
MNKEFIPYEQALSMEKLGFVERCFGFYTLEGYYFPNTTPLNSLTYGCEAPLYQQAFRWFREKGIVNSIRSHNDKCHEYYLIHNGKAFQSYHSSTYEQAELECLNHLIRLLNQNK